MIVCLDKEAVLPYQLKICGLLHRAQSDITLILLNTTISTHLYSASIRQGLLYAQ